MILGKVKLVKMTKMVRNLISKEVNTNKKKSETDVEKYTFIQTNNDWFLSLFRSFKLHEDYLKNFSDQEKETEAEKGRICINGDLSSQGV